jgi:hypothetical protein
MAAGGGCVLDERVVFPGLLDVGADVRLAGLSDVRVVVRDVRLALAWRMRFGTRFGIRCFVM